MPLDDLPFVVADTEDNTPELIKAGQSLFDKQITEIAAIGRNGERWYGKEPDQFLLWLAKQAGEKDWLRVYFHNLQYDLGAFFSNRLDALDQLLVGGRLIRARWRNIEFRDSLNIWPMSVAAIGKSVELEKLKPSDPGYVWRDVEIVRKAMTLAYREAENYGVPFKSFPSTLGGLCVKIWHAQGGVNTQNCWQQAKQAYYGGRVELFNRGGTGHIVYVDVNSLYPSVMLNAFPDSWEMLDDFSKGWGVARVRIEIPKSFICPLPVRKEDGSIYYPWGVVDGDEEETKEGHRNGVWTFHELRNAVKYGAKVTKIYECFGSLTASHYYRDFVTEFYRKRNETEDEGLRTYYKLLMNNLYGQLAMSGNVTRTLDAMSNVLRGPDNEPIVSESGNYIINIDPERHPRLFGTKVMADCKMPLPEHVNYLHGAYVTSYARLMLQDFLRKVPERNLIYCDTDSIMFFHDPAKPLPFPISKELGAMKLEGIADRLVVHAPKIYEMDRDGKTTYKAKGVPRRESEEEPGKTYAQLFIERGRAEFYQPFKMRESIIFYDRAKENVAKHPTLSIWRKVEKVKRTTYAKKNEKDGTFFPKKRVDEKAAS